ncbi:MAG TPA: molecular chaperone DnaJ, partial [Thermoanaerobaculia bacterium]|nr:molecular chaperone DnaJ [Thermoanaerobaculia bacterium]
VFSLKAKGIPRLDGRGRGDQHVLVTIRVPKKMNAAQRDAVQRLAHVFEDGTAGAPTKDEKGFFSRLKDFLSE